MSAPPGGSLSQHARFRSPMSTGWSRRGMIASWRETVDTGGPGRGGLRALFRRLRSGFLLLPQLVALILAPVAPAADLWPRWQAHDASSHATIDYGPWARFLDAYLVQATDGVNRVRYAAVGAADRAALADFIADIARLPISRYDRDEQVAYWINLYNALTVEVVLEHYPIASIRDVDISPGWFSNGPWGAKLIAIEGERLSLDDIEHRILRPIWRDARIHYAVNCSALGCPNLQPEPFRAEMLDAQLDRAARAYVNGPRGVRTGDGELVVSSIYGWFQEDFGGSEQSVLEHLERYAEPELRRQLERFTSIDGYAYDWSLNDASHLAAIASSP